MEGYTPMFTVFTSREKSRLNIKDKIESCL